MPAPPAPFTRAEFERGERTVLNAGRWANAVVYRLARPDGEWVVKDFAPRHWLVRATIGAFLVGRETRALSRLAGVDGVPGDAFRLDRHALACRYLRGTPLHQTDDRPPPPAFFEAFEALMGRIHARGLVHLDNRNARNVIVRDDGSPGLIDFQSYLATGWLPQRWRRGIERFDLAGVYKHWYGRWPDTLGRERLDILERMNRRRRLWVLRGYPGRRR
jgi:RIO-like serine/threonine protein kinase